MKDKEFLTVAEFSKLTGKTTQYIYRLFHTRLSPFAKIDKGQKYIHIDGAGIFDDESDDETDIQQVQNEVSTELIDTLMNQLDEKDKQISELNARLEQSLRLNENNQIILMNTTKLLTDNVKKSDDIFESAEKFESADSSEMPGKKRNSFLWFFKK